MLEHAYLRTPGVVLGLAAAFTLVACGGDQGGGQTEDAPTPDETTAAVPDEPSDDEPSTTENTDTRDVGQPEVTCEDPHVDQSMRDVFAVEFRAPFGDVDLAWVCAQGAVIVSKAGDRMLTVALDPQADKSWLADSRISDSRPMMVPPRR